MRWFVALIGVALFARADLAAAGPDPVSTPTIHAAAARAVVALETSIRVWHQNRTCFSCHHQGLPIVLTAEARTRGIAIDETLARLNIRRGLQGLKNLDRAVQSAQQIDPALETGSMLVAARAAGVPAGLVREVYATTVAKRQLADGSWQTLDNRPPQSFSPVTATAIAVTAMRAYAPAAHAAESQERTRRALKWLLATHPRDTEERAFQILGAVEAGADRDAVRALGANLLTEQRPDGGWAQLPSRQSDAYATGEALVALRSAGVALTDPGFQRGLGYLLSTQYVDGTWRVDTRMHEQAIVSPPHFEIGFPHGEHQMISATATSWAARALFRALPERRMVPEPLVTPSEWRLEDEAPWMSVAISGSVADLERLLEGGLDPNSHTTGGTTALMMAAGDHDKVSALIRHGADVNLAAKTGFTPLIVAANDPGAVDAIRVLVDHGASVTPTSPKPLHDASPLFFAAWAGNVESVRLLLDRGANPRAKMNLAGIFALTPLEIAVLQGDAAMIRALNPTPADLNRVSDAGISSLTAAVMANRVDMVRTLIAMGAKVNDFDELSMTPLMHAALVDFGDTAVVELLLLSGAETKATSKDGLTALDFARREGHLAAARLLAQAAPGN